MNLKYEIIKKTRNLEFLTFTRELYFDYISNYHYTEIYLRAQILIYFKDVINNNYKASIKFDCVRIT